MRSSVYGFAVAAVLTTSSAAGGDADDADDVDVSPLTHERAFEIRVGRGDAEITLHETLVLDQRDPGPGSVEITLPASAVVVGMRSHAGDVATACELRDPESARRLFMSGRAGGPPDSTVLSWAGSEVLELAVTPLLPRVPKLVDLRALAPTEYRGGAHHIVVGPLGSNEADVFARVWTRGDGGSLLVDGRIVPEGVTVRLDREHDVALVDRGAPPLSASVAVVPLPGERFFTRVDVRAAVDIDPAPEGAYVVIAVDGSRSIAQPSALVAAARAYLAEMPGARVAVEVFDREARIVGDDFAPAPVADARLADLVARPQRNGSEIGAALGLADARLMNAPRGAARRIVVLTDLATRSGLDPKRLPPIASGATVHVAAVTSGAPSLARDDDSAWSAVTRPTGGLVWSASANVSARNREEIAEMRRTFEEWAHPLRVDGIDWGLPRSLASDAPSVLDAGEGFTHVQIGAPLPLARVRGEAWSRRVVAGLGADAAATRVWTALALALPVDLTEADIRALAARSNAVTEHTSLVCPSAGAHRGEGMGGIGGALGGPDSSTGIHLGSIGTISRDGATLPPPPDLEPLFAPVFGGCGGAPGTASVVVETTESEIVDVRSVRIAGVAAGSPLERCLVEGIWATLLPRGLTGHATRTVAL